MCCIIRITENRMKKNIKDMKKQSVLETDFESKKTERFYGISYTFYEDNNNCPSGEYVLITDNSSCGYETPHIQDEIIMHNIIVETN